MKLIKIIISFYLTSFAFVITSCQKSATDIGEKNPPHEETEVVELLNFSSSNDTGIELVDIDLDNGTVTMDVPEGKIPQEGDILCSGITDKTPYGFLVQVTEVKAIGQTKGVTGDLFRFSVRIQCVSLYSALKALGVPPVQQWFELLPQGSSTVSDHSGREIETPTDNGVMEIDFPIEPIPGITITFYDKISLPSLRFYLDTTTPDITIGYDMKVENDARIHLSGSVKCVTSGDLYEKYGLWELRKTYEFLIGPVPVIVTVKITPVIPYKLGLEAGYDYDLFRDNRIMEIGGMFSSWNCSFSCIPGMSDYFESEPIPDSRLTYPGLQTELHLKGSASIGVGMKCSIGLYGGNIINDDDPGRLIKLEYLTLGAEGGISFDCSSSLTVNQTSDDSFMNSTSFVDDFNFTAKLAGKIWGTVFKAEAGNKEVKVLSGEKEWSVVTTSYYGSLFLPSYSGLKVKDINSDGCLVVAAKKVNPIFPGYFYVSGQGFCIQENNTENPVFYYTDESPEENVSGWSSCFEDRNDQELSVSIPISGLKTNVKYSVFPFVKVSDLDCDRVIFREGIYFIISDDGRVSSSLIDDVPGEKL